jgi:hypothetical protein
MARRIAGFVSVFAMIHVVLALYLDGVVPWSDVLVSTLSATGFFILFTHLIDRMRARK